MPPRVGQQAVGASLLFSRPGERSWGGFAQGRVSGAALGFAAGGVGTGIPSALASGGERTEPGLPQLDPTLYAGQVFWLVVLFGLFYLVLRFGVLPQMRRIRDKRHMALEVDLTAAAAANDRAAAIRSQIKDLLAEAHAEARAKIVARTADIKQAIQSREDTNQGALQQRILQADETLATSQEQAMQELPRDVTSLAEGLAQRVLVAAGGRDG